MLILVIITLLTVIHTVFAQVPLVAIPVEVSAGKLAYLEVFDGQSVNDAVDNFLSKSAVDEQNRDMLVQEVKARWASRLERIEITKKQLEITGENVTPVSVPISITVPLTLDLSSGEDVTIAAINFARKYGLSSNVIPTLVQLLNEKLQDNTEQEKKERKELFTLNIADVGELKYFEGQDATQVATAFLTEHNLLRDENVNIIVSNINSNLLNLK